MRSGQTRGVQSGAVGAVPGTAPLLRRRGCVTCRYCVEKRTDGNPPREDRAVPARIFWPLSASLSAEEFRPSVCPDAVFRSTPPPSPPSHPVKGSGAAGGNFWLFPASTRVMEDERLCRKSGRQVLKMEHSSGPWTGFFSASVT